MKIFLIGLPGSGKTTIGNALAKEIKFNYLDLDKILERNEGRLIEEIWATDGEPYFRVLEKANLKNQIPNQGNYVIACGGGIVLDIENKKYMDGLKIFLDTDINTLKTRLKSEEDKRPLMKTVSVEILHDVRYPLYKDFSDIIVTNNYDVNTTIKVIINYLKAVYGKDFNN
ncbi:MAG: shikimate kinase [Acholeplasmatales bacterium]|jgi:shikimate kinase|nr:shikimate kinase [Acholeplasmatales bacterium]